MLHKVFSVLFLAALATANLHNNCACHNGESYNWRITADACKVYNDAKYKVRSSIIQIRESLLIPLWWGGATYDAASGRCTQADSSAKIAGKEWEAACRQIAQTGFGCVDGQGWCYAARDDVRGRC